MQSRIYSILFKTSHSFGQNKNLETFRQITLFSSCKTFNLTYLGIFFRQITLMFFKTLSLSQNFAKLKKLVFKNVSAVWLKVVISKNEKRKSHYWAQSNSAWTSLSLCSKIDFLPIHLWHLDGGDWVFPKLTFH